MNNLFLSHTQRLFFVKCNKSNYVDKVRTLIEETAQAKNKNLSYSFDSDENLHTFVKSKIKQGNRHEFFSQFLHRERFIHRKRK